MTVRVILAVLLGVLLVSPAPASAARADLKVMTANVEFGPRSEQRVKELFRTSAARADVVLLQEARDVRLTRELTGPGWAIRQDRSTKATRGTAVVVRQGTVRRIGPLILTPAGQAHPCGVANRSIASVRLVLENGTAVRAASVHMPPGRCAQPGEPYDAMADNVVAFANHVPAPLILGGDWNKVVDRDPNGIARRSNLMTRGMDRGKRIDGFMVERRPAIRAAEPRRLPGFGSDHQPVLLKVSVR